MISQQQKNLQGAEEELSPTPAEEKQFSTVSEEKQATTVSEGRSRHTPASPPRWISVLFCILGIAMPLIAGWMIFWPWRVGDIFDSVWVYVPMLIAPVVSVVVGAFLLGFAFRRWWPGLLVPVAWLVGEYVSAAFLVDWGGHFWNFEPVPIILTVVILIPLGVIGGLVGNAFRRRWEKRRQITTSDRS